MDTYSTAELLTVARLSEPNFKAWVRRGFLRPTSGTPGTGKPRSHTRMDVLQARLLVILRNVGVPLPRCAVLWPSVAATLHEPRFLIVEHRDDGGEPGSKLLRHGEDAGWDHADGPAAAVIVNVGKLAREVAGQLMSMRASP